VPTPAILDNLVAAGLVPPMVAVLIESLDYGTRARELTCNPTFLAFLTDELLPWVERSHAVTSDPAQTVVAGSSLGGLTAAYAALRRPDRFGLVLSQSGAFSWSPPGDEEAEWLARQVAAGALGVRSGGGGPRPPARPRFYLNVGLYETGRAFLPDGPSLRLANRHLRDVLRAGGYAVRYAESAGGHDELGFRATFPEGLLALCGRSTAAGASAG
jgi:enterochelin esterase-like enzyme